MFAVGAGMAGEPGGAVLHFDGSGWTTTNPTRRSCSASGLSASDVFAVGAAVRSSAVRHEDRRGDSRQPDRRALALQQDPLGPVPVEPVAPLVVHLVIDADAEYLEAVGVARLRDGMLLAFPSRFVQVLQLPNGFS